MIPCAHRYCKKLFVPKQKNNRFCSDWCSVDEHAMIRKPPQKPCRPDRASWYKRRLWRVKRTLATQPWRARRTGVRPPHTKFYSAGSIQRATANQLIRRVNSICGGRVGYVGYR